MMVSRPRSARAVADPRGLSFALALFAKLVETVIFEERPVTGEATCHAFASSITTTALLMARPRYWMVALVAPTALVAAAHRSGKSLKEKRSAS
jgi:hypothetical protein